MNTRRTALTAVLAAATISLTGCSSHGTAHPTVTVTTEHTTTPSPAPTDTDITAAVVDLSWDQQTEDDKDAMCLGIALQGPAWAAEQMEAGGGDTAGVDWDRAAQLVAQKCADR